MTCKHLIFMLQPVSERVCSEQLIHTCTIVQITVVQFYYLNWLEHYIANTSVVIVSTDLQRRRRKKRLIQTYTQLHNTYDPWASRKDEYLVIE